MPILSETETTSARNMDRVLEALPVLRRWLLRSGPAHRHQEGHRPPPLSHIRVLIHLYQRGPMAMGELARALGISCSTATECIGSLEARGRVVRQRSQFDRRQVLVSLTPEAEAMASQVLIQRKVIVGKVLEQLSPKERQAFVRGLLLLAQGAEEWMDRSASPAMSTNIEEQVAHAR